MPNAGARRTGSLVLPNPHTCVLIIQLDWSTSSDSHSLDFLIPEIGKRSYAKTWSSEDGRECEIDLGDDRGSVRMSWLSGGEYEAVWVEYGPVHDSHFPLEPTGEWMPQLIEGVTWQADVAGHHLVAVDWSTGQAGPRS